MPKTNRVNRSAVTQPDEGIQIAKFDLDSVEVRFNESEGTYSISGVTCGGGFKKLTAAQVLRWYAENYDFIDGEGMDSATKWGRLLKEAVGGAR